MKIRRGLWAAALLINPNIHALAATHYVDANGTNPVSPYLSWATAATNIQDALNASFGYPDLVLVTNGVYQYGGYSYDGSNRVYLNFAQTVQSVNGPAVTIIEGYQVPGTTNGANAVRCVFLEHGTTLSGFTLTNGASPSLLFGGGVYCPVTNCFVTNCVIINNVGYVGAGGAFRGTLINCSLIGNTTSPNADGGGGAFQSTLIDCRLAWNSTANEGGAAYECTLTNCTVAGNSAGTGGGVYRGTLNACLVSNNIATNGGGAYVSSLYNSLIVGNSASLGGGLYGGNVYNCTLAFNSATNSGGGIYGGTGAYCYNSILYYNTAPNWSNNIGAKLFNCCTIPDSFDSGGITNEPLFVNLVGGDFHLQSNSPCINSGNSKYVTGVTDLDDNTRIVGGTVDMGAYEYQTPTSVISYAWLQQYGLPNDGSVDYADLDGTGFTIYQDWIAGLNPTNALSVLAMLPPTPTNNPLGLIVSWESVNNRTYFLQSSTNLGMQPSFSIIQSNIVGQTGTTSYTDTTATTAGPYFYRVGVQQ